MGVGLSLPAPSFPLRRGGGYPGYPNKNGYGALIILSHVSQGNAFSKTLSSGRVAPCFLGHQTLRLLFYKGSVIWAPFPAAAPFPLQGAQTPPPPPARKPFFELPSTAHTPSLLRIRDPEVQGTKPLPWLECTCTAQPVAHPQRPNPFCTGAQCVHRRLCFLQKNAASGQAFGRPTALVPVLCRHFTQHPRAPAHSTWLDQRCLAAVSCGGCGTTGRCSAAVAPAADGMQRPPEK